MPRTFGQSGVFNQVDSSRQRFGIGQSEQSNTIQNAGPAAGRAPQLDANGGWKDKLRCTAARYTQFVVQEIGCFPVAHRAQMKIVRHTLADSLHGWRFKDRQQ